MKLLKEVFKWFLYITTGVLIVTAACFTLEGVEMITVGTLWKILLASLLTTLVTVGFVGNLGRSRCMMVLHYVVLCVVMIFCGNMFGWMELELSGIFCMCIAVAVVYLLSALAYWMIDQKQAEEINKKLQDKYKDIEN